MKYITPSVRSVAKNSLAMEWGTDDQGLASLPVGYVPMAQVQSGGMYCHGAESLHAQDILKPLGSLDSWKSVNGMPLMTKFVQVGATESTAGG